MKRFILILQFMTRIPINKELDVNREDFSRGVIYFPIIGLIVGLFDGLMVYFSYMLFPPIIAGIIGLLAHIFITGAIHIDGFSDTIDGIFSSRKRDRILEIMKDSRLGTFGGVGLIILLMLKASLFTLLGGNLYGYIIIILSPVLSRSISTFFMYRRKYARENEGLGDLFIDKISKKNFIITNGITIILIILINIKLIFPYILTLIIMIMIRRYVENKIGGITGDILGFSIEFSEIVFMLITTSNFVWGILWN